MDAGAASGVGRGREVRGLVGRRAELAELRGAFDAAIGGRGDVVLVSGEPGIGKTALLGALADEAEVAGAVVLRGAGWEGGGAPAHWPWVQAIRALAAATPDDDRLRAYLGHGAGFVAALVPELRDRLGDLPQPSIEGEQARFSLFDAVTRLLVCAAADRPVVLVLDDLHAADHSSLLLLEFVGRLVRGTRVLAVAAYREPELRGRPEAAEVLARASRAGRRLALKGLSRDDVAELVGRHGTRPPRSLVDRLHGLTDGNPFFTDELTRLLLDAPSASLTSTEELSLPETVLDTIRRRLVPLNADLRRTLAAAAVVGREFALDTLAAAANEPAVTVLERLDEAIDAGLVEARGPGRHAFVHALVREALYEELPRSRRVELHRRVAEALHRAPGEEAHLSELAHHFFLAAPGGDARPAIDYAVRAGDRAMAMLAYEQAAELYELALRALELAGADDRTRCDLLLARGDALMRSGQVDAARATLAEAGNVARRLSAPDRMARAALLSSPWGLSLNVADVELIRLLEDALRGAVEATTRARLTAALAVALYWSAPADKRLRLVEEAIALARASGDRAILARVLGDAHIATWNPDSAERSIPWADELLAIADELGDLELAVHAYSWRTSLLVEIGDIDAVEHAIAVFTALAEQLRQPRAAASALRYRVLRCTLQGRFEEIDELLDEQARLAGAQSDRAIDVQLVAGQVFGLRWVQGRLAELEPAVRYFADSLPAMPAWRCALLAVHRDAGKLADLRMEYERMAAAGFESLPRDNLLLVALSLLSEACAELGDARGAERLEALLEPYADRMVVVPGAAVLGPVSRALGLLALTRGDLDAARRRFEAAAAVCMRMLARPMLALVALDLARVNAAAGDVSAARVELEEARSIAQDVGMPGVLDRVDRLAESLGPVPAPAAEPAAEPAPVQSDERRLRRIGDHWLVTAGDRSFTLRDVKGLHHLACLLGTPRVEVHALELATDRRAAFVPPSAAEPGLRTEGDAGALLDPAAKAAYRDRMEELEADIEEAERFHDGERAARAREELEFLQRELAAAVGLGGRDRKAASNAEKARLNVTRAIKAAIDRIGQHDAGLAEELRATVHTGTFCEYRPLPSGPSWRVDAA